MNTHVIKNGQKVKLGRIRPKARPQSLRFSSFFKPTDTPPPATVDYTTKALDAIHQMYMNDSLGDCVIASSLHKIGVWSGNEFGTPVIATDTEAQDQYYAFCGNGLHVDNGCVITSVLDIMQSQGMVAGGKNYKIDGYCAVDWTNKLESQVAIYLFGTVKLGINLPGAWLNTNDGDLWDVTDSGIVGGHDVPAIGYNETGVIIATWGGLRTITWAAFQNTQWVEEAYAVLAPLWYTNQNLSPVGFDASALQNALKTLAGGNIPPITPVPVPLPPSPPAPVPPPVVPPSPPVPVPPPAKPLTVTGVAAGTIEVPTGVLGRTQTITVSLPVTGVAQ